ncbi:tetratricopeptide repeat protein [Lewinella cohaerens]|uniref:tetratricopeptide repeat protein n=1 Tax=Lewinella cohaerens TaxID=70995 RepID=UPI00037AB775|nr:tetratricopeptide repeat protein [Lewinella cohaerens]
MPYPPNSKNIVHGSITAGGNVHIGDIIYNIERDFKSGSILFLRLDKQGDTHYAAHLSIKSKHSEKGTLATAGEKWCENITVDIPPQLFDDLTEFQNFRRSVDTHTRYHGIGNADNHSVQALENKLAQQVFQTFFAGEIGKACSSFIQLLEDNRIEELLLAISADEETIVNLPFEIVLPLLFPSKLGEAKQGLARSNFGLIRTKTTSLEAFKMQGDHATAAPLKMLFITALPENLDERGKMLQIEEEQTRLIQAIGVLEATGDRQPKIVIEFLENASLAELDKALRTRQHDIVHISGHGAYHAAKNKGLLYFENEDGDEERVTGAALGETLRQHACVKLLILSACETAIAGSEGGVTEQVAAYGVPSIVAMRFAVTDEGAKVFTTEFYTHLAKGISVTQSVAYARDAMHDWVMEGRQNAPQVLHIAEWFTPVVYQNQSVGALIDKAQPYHLPDNFYPSSSFLKTKHSRLIGEGFIGRKRYLIQMRQAFRAGRHLCLHGLGGLGKTTLAEAFAHNYDNRSHTNIIFRNGNQINEKFVLDELLARLEETEAAKSTIRQLKARLDDPQTPVLDKLQLLIDNYLDGRKTILTFDNAEDVQIDEGRAYQRSIGSESLHAFLKHLCENTPANCHILFTTRYKIENLADVVEHLALDKMGYAEQYRLLNYSKILRTIPLQDRGEVYKRLDGHPRGYEYLEALLKKDKTFSWQQVAKAEADVFENLLLAKVYERLTEREQAIFQMGSVFIARTPLPALAAVSGEKEAELAPVIKALQDWSLCFLEKDGRFEVHRLTREWMTKNIIPAAEVKKWAFAAANYFKEQPALKNYELAREYFGIAKAWAEFATVSFRLQDHYQLIGLYQKAFELNQAVLEKNVAEKSIGMALFNMGAVLNLYGQNDQALQLYKQSLAITQQIVDRQGEGAILSSIGLIYHAKGDYDTALRYMEQSLAIIQQISDPSSEGGILNNISQIHEAKGDYDTALRYLEQGLAIAQQIGDRKGEGTILGNIGQTYHSQGDYDTALRYMKQSLTIVQQIGDRRGEGTALNNISQIHKARGDYDRALHYLEQSLAIRQQIGDRRGEGATLNNLATTALTKGDYDTALGYLKQSLAIRQQIGDRHGYAKSVSNIGAIYFMQDKIEEALSLLIQGYLIYQELGSPDIQEPAGFLSELQKIMGKEKFDEKVQEVISKMG